MSRNREQDSISKYNCMSTTIQFLLLSYVLVFFIILDVNSFRQQVNMAWRRLQHVDSPYRSRLRAETAVHKEIMADLVGGAVHGGPLLEQSIFRQRIFSSCPFEEEEWERSVVVLSSPLVFNRHTHECLHFHCYSDSISLMWNVIKGLCWMFK